MKKQIKQLIIFLIVFIIFSLTLFIAMAGGSDIPILATVPFVGPFQIILLLLLVSGAAIVAVIIGVLFARVILILHVKIVGKKLNYSMQEVNPPENDVRIGLASFPTFMAITFAISLSSNTTVQNLIVNPIYSAGTLPLSFITFLGLLPLVIFLGMLIFVPIWLVLKSGIVFSNKQKVDGTAQPVELMSVGRWYLYLLKGYAGIGALFGFYMYLSESLIDILSVQPQYMAGAIVSLVLFLIMPFIIVIYCIPALLVFERIQKKIISSLRKKAIKMAIPEVPKPNQ